MAAQLNALNAMITALPEIGTIGTVFAMTSKHPSEQKQCRHVEVRGLPKHARPGRPLQFDLDLFADYHCTARRPPLPSFLVQVDAWIGSGEVSTPAPAAGGRGVVVSLPVPEITDRNSRYTYRWATHDAWAVAACTCAVVTGMLASLQLEGAMNIGDSTPAICSDGTQCSFKPPSIHCF
jgi:hypothetical protein